MPQWAGSSWYFLRYASPHANDALITEQGKKWLPVDLYVGGVEHAVLHLLYSRFFTMFLYDIGVVGFEEPFKRLFNQGMITYIGKSGKAEKMSKSKGNVVNPDELVQEYGCDSLRMYELFVGPPGAGRRVERQRHRGRASIPETRMALGDDAQRSVVRSPVARDPCPASLAGEECYRAAGVFPHEHDCQRVHGIHQ